MASSKAVSSRESGEKTTVADAKKEFLEGAESAETPLKPGEVVEVKLEEAKLTMPAKVGKKKSEAEEAFDRVEGEKAKIKDKPLNLGKQPAKEEPQKAWLIQKDASIILNKTLVHLRAGQRVTRQTHDLDTLRSCGVVLAPVR